MSKEPDIIIDAFSDFRPSSNDIYKISHRYYRDGFYAVAKGFLSHRSKELEQLDIDHGPSIRFTTGQRLRLKTYHQIDKPVIQRTYFDISIQCTIGLPSGHRSKFEYVRELSRWEVSKLKLDSRKNWFTPYSNLKRIENRSTYRTQTVIIDPMRLVGWRRLPRKWIPEFDVLLIPKDNSVKPPVQKPKTLQEQLNELKSDVRKITFDY